MNLDKENIRRLKGLILFTVVLVVAGFNYRSLMGVIVWIFKMLVPFLLGAVIAFILNVPMRQIENMLKSAGMRGNKMLRPLSLALTIIFVSGILMVGTFLILPELLNTLASLQESVPLFLNNVKKGLEQVFEENQEIAFYISRIEIDWQGVMGKIMAFLSSGAGSMLNSTVSAAISIVSGVTTFGIGLIFSIYILMQKENLARQFKKFMNAYLKQKQVDRILEVLDLTERTFSSFLTGQCLEAVILGTMFFITLTLFKMPYALLIGVLIGFTALIPIFGAFIGCAIGAFLMLITSPASALYFLVIFFVLQQIEGNLIYPYVVGNSVGLPSIWVLVAVTIGGSAMGIVGMLVFIPLCSVGYSLMRDEVNARINRKVK